MAPRTQMQQCNFNFTLHVQNPPCKNGIVLSWPGKLWKSRLRAALTWSWPIARTALVAMIALWQQVLGAVWLAWLRRATSHITVFNRTKYSPFTDWSADQRASGSVDERVSGSADQRISGSANQRISGSADQRISGPADRRTGGSADQRISGSADQRISGSADQRISGSADQRISGSADQRISGSADQRISGPADQTTPRS